VDADGAAAAGALPSCFFFADEFSCAGLFYVFQVLDHAHAVLCPVSFVQVVYCAAGKTPALKTEFMFPFS
jgi:hypothetical protein